MQHDDFDQTKYEEMSDQEKLGLLNLITEDFHDQINEVQSCIEDLEYEREKLETEKGLFLKEQKAVRVRLGIDPTPGQLKLFSAQAVY
jgi:hypothetical protein